MRKYFVIAIISSFFLMGCLPRKAGSLTETPTPTTTPAPTTYTMPTPSPVAEVTITTPTVGEVVKSPQRVHGFAPGPWFFEANIVVKLLDEQGKVLAQNGGQAKGEWMIEKLVEFESKLIFTVPAGQTRGMLVIENDNPSGLPENQKSFSMPVRLR